MHTKFKSTHNMNRWQHNIIITDFKEKTCDGDKWVELVQDRASQTATNLQLLRNGWLWSSLTISFWLRALFLQLWSEKYTFSRLSTYRSWKIWRETTVRLVRSWLVLNNSNSEAAVQHHTGSIWNCSICAISLVVCFEYLWDFTVLLQ
jgi:hypothetical protein